MESTGRMSTMFRTFRASGEPPERAQRIKVKLADGKERTIEHMMATSF